MQDRLYLNDGKGNFQLSPRAFRNNGMNTSVAVAYDYDSDGDQDLFVGSRSMPNQYGLPPMNYLYKNNGKAEFVNISTNRENEALGNAGMITDAKWVNLIGDEKKELLLVGEWNAPKIFSFEGDKAILQKSNLSELEGWWYTCEAADLDKDGDQDLILGNVGHNFYLKADAENPLKLWINDFDDNRAFDKVMTRTIDGKDKPVFLKKDLAEQIVSIKKQNIMHVDYAEKSIQDILPKDKLDKSLKRQANYLQSCIALNEGNGTFKIQTLPDEIQLSCVNDVTVFDVNQDGNLDLITGGNKYGFLPQFSKLDACRGNYLQGDGKGNFELVPPQNSGLNLDGEVRQISVIQTNGKNQLLVLLNDEKPLLYEIE